MSKILDLMRAIENSSLKLKTNSPSLIIYK